MKEYYENDDYKQLVEDYKVLDRQYKDTKGNIGYSRSIEEQRFWQRRGDTIEEKLNKVGGEIESYRRNALDGTKGDTAAEKLEKMQAHYKDIDRQYNEAKGSIMFSRNNKERLFWQQRTSELSKQRKQLGDNIKSFRNRTLDGGESVNDTG